MKTVLVSVLCADRTGLVAAITGRLFDLGANLGDTTFAVLGGGGEFASVCDVPVDISPDEIRKELQALPEIGDGKVTVEPFSLAADHGPSGRVTHRIVVSGGNRPGLVARLSEVFVQFKANIVELNAQRVRNEGGDLYLTRFAVWIPGQSVESCLATVDNTAGELSLSCRWETVDS
ncbi:MAG: amino acid-binding protein [Alphaproteobacteria bacterium]|nr:amino acid-binding protein [Alphaproteobacteria bacterium]MBF0129835.1 amino acid-binding protein [Alphaproteobacteria bacterium]